MRDDDLREFFDGKKLWGDNFTPSQIQAWFEDEREGYASLPAAEHCYCFHALDTRHGYRHLPRGRFAHVLGIGSGYGDEFLPIIDRVDQLTIVEASLKLRSTSVGSVPVRFVDPDASGTLPFETGTFDLATAFSVLHHIPNVSLVISELARCLKPGGHLLLREPIVSMGDWRRPRAGLTKHERGIPRDLLRTFVRDAGLQIVRETLVGFPLIAKVAQVVRVEPYNHQPIVVLDTLVARAVEWNLRYHATTALEKIRPTGVFLVLRKRS